MRIKLIAWGFLLLGILILTRLFSWQVTKGDELKILARSQHETTRALPAQRGQILASDGFPLATSREGWLLWASLPDLKEDAATVARRLAPLVAPTVEDFISEATPAAKTRPELVAEEEARILAILGRDSARWVPLAHKVSREQRAEIEKLQIAGLGFDPEDTRDYPEGTMAAHLLGFVGKDEAGSDRGYFGLEGFYDLTLGGVAGELLQEKNPQGIPILTGLFRRVKPLDGMTLKTHLDRSLQFFVEKRLSEGLEKYGAKSGSVIVARPEDGGILAMASLPAYDPVQYSQASSAAFLNPAVGESFEPGSVFKTVVMSAALDSGAVKPDSRCDQCGGPRQIAEYTIGTWNDKYYPNTTAREIIQHSDNVGMIWVAEELGIEKLYEYLVRFGFGQATGIDLQDEADPPLRAENDWNVVDLAVAGFGQGISVTPIQILQAVGAVANGGVLVTPQVVDKIQNDGFEQDIKPKVVGRVISQEAAREMTEMMVNAVENGEAKWAKPRGFAIAGKTGTAQIPVRGHYDEEKTIASFIGFAPAQNPKFVMLVTLREPSSSPWGSETAAPLWFSIARDLFPYLGIQPE